VINWSYLIPSGPTLWSRVPFDGHLVPLDVHLISSNAHFLDLMSNWSHSLLTFSTWCPMSTWPYLIPTWSHAIWTTWCPHGHTWHNGV